LVGNLHYQSITAKQIIWCFYMFSCSTSNTNQWISVKFGVCAKTFWCHLNFGLYFYLSYPLFYVKFILETVCHIQN
jgi:hypothetical protein